MTYNIAAAFLHHAAAFLLVAALTVELVLLAAEPTPATARSLVRIDALYGIAALVVIVVGLLRVFYTEKGAAYYFHSVPFIAKLVLFAIVGLLSIYPTREFLSWRKTLVQGQLPVLAPDQRRALRRVVHVELVLVLGILLCAVLAARGVGYVG